jgi:hypothetical protein
MERDYLLTVPSHQQATHISVIVAESTVFLFISSHVRKTNKEAGEESKDIVSFFYSW